MWVRYPLPVLNVCKVFEDKGLGLDFRADLSSLRLNAKPRLVAGALFRSRSSISDGVELIRHAYVLRWQGVWVFWGLTACLKDYVLPDGPPARRAGVRTPF